MTELVPGGTVYPGEPAFYPFFTPHPVPLATLARVAGIRWSIEECFQAAKGCVGLDHDQVRTHRSWNRHTTLAMLALAILSVAAGQPGGDGEQDLIRLTVNEIRRLIGAPLLAAAPTTTAVLAWSAWRRQHQARARQAHHQTRLST